MADSTVRSPLVRGILWTLRILLVFALLAALLALIYWLGYDSYRNVAEWAEPGSHEALIYEEEVYYLAGRVGQKGLTKSKYPIDKVLGQVRDDGTPVETEPVTTEAVTTAAPETLPPDPEDTEPEEETDPPVESVVPPIGAELFEEEKHSYILYSVKKKEDFLIVLEQDGEYYVYYREGTENPLETTK